MHYNCVRKFIERKSEITVGYQVAQLRIAIEVMRKELLRLGKIKPLTDPEVVKLSQRLDKMLNEYNRLTKKYTPNSGEL